MDIFISTSGKQPDYGELVAVDKEIRSAEHDALEWTPAMIFAQDDSLKYSRRYRELCKRHLGMENISGPFYEEYYMDGPNKIFL